MGGLSSSICDQKWIRHVMCFAPALLWSFFPYCYIPHNWELQFYEIRILSNFSVHVIFLLKTKKNILVWLAPIIYLRLFYSRDKYVINFVAHDSSHMCKMRDFAFFVTVTRFDKIGRFQGPSMNFVHSQKLPSSGISTKNRRSDCVKTLVIS